jgi:hypothetical protein
VDAVAVIPDPEPGTTPLSSVDGSGPVSDVGDPNSGRVARSDGTRVRGVAREGVTLVSTVETVVAGAEDVVLEVTLEVVAGVARVVVGWFVDLDTVEEP